LGGIEAREELETNKFGRYENDNKKRCGKLDGKNKGQNSMKWIKNSHHSQL
jgi:hypothetical protein